MGFFSMFGGTENKYSNIEHQLSELEINKLVSEITIKTLKQGEEDLVEHTLLQRRHGDGKISLRQIYESLTQLKNQHKISVYDRDGLIKVFESYYATHKV
ncbi:MAG: hypothetical protein Q7S24_01425 [bacterium]|nr:hypothetical protein [bacterium]